MFFFKKYQLGWFPKTSTPKDEKHDLTKVVYPCIVPAYLPTNRFVLDPIQSYWYGSSHLVSGLVHPSYKWINPTYPM